MSITNEIADIICEFMELDLSNKIVRQKDKIFVYLGDGEVAEITIKGDK